MGSYTIGKLLYCIAKIGKKGCKYCKFNSRRGCKLNLVPVKNELCYEKKCFSIVK